MLNKSRLILSVLIGTSFVLNAGFAAAQEYPTRPIRLIVPNSPGSYTDTVARIIGPDLGQILGQPVVVENKAGADGIIGFEYVAKQVPADGYTMASVTVPNLAILPAITKDLRFDPLKDLPPFIGLVEARVVLASPPQLQQKSFNELVAYARANPGKLNFGSSAPISRLSMEALLRDAGLNVVHIPYSGGAAYYQALLSGDIHMGTMSLSTALPYGPKLRILAITGDRRLPALPDVPTFKELGRTQIQGLSSALNLPAGTPKPVFDKLYAAASNALKRPEVRERFTKVMSDITDQTPDVAAKDLADQAKLFSDVAKKIGFEVK